MPKKSVSIQDKLNRLFVEDQVTEEFGTLLSGTLSPERFDDPKQFRDYLCEGALLNISTLASHSLSIPAGEYMVWVTDVGHTMLVPTKEEKHYQEVLEGFSDQYEVLTPDLIKHWSKVERVLAEDFGQEGGGFSGSEDSGGSEENEGEQPEGKGNQIKSRVNPGDIDRPPMLRAMEDRGYTVTSLAADAGVQPPAISRLLRSPKDRQGDPGGRNPSMELAAKISRLLRMDLSALFPDIFGGGSKEDFEARSTPGNRGSGMKNAAAGSMRKGGKNWTQGGAG